MNNVRIEAIKLRKLGKSYSEITGTLGVPKSTLSGWLKSIELNESARARLRLRVHQGVQNSLVKRNKLQTKVARERAFAAEQRTEKLIGKLSDRELALVGAALYWGEGYKKLAVRYNREIVAHEVSFVNADPEMIRLFLEFIKLSLGIRLDEIHLGMRLYKHINEDVARKYWIGITGLQSGHFKQTTWLVSGASKRKRPKDSLPYGTLQVVVYRTEKFHELMGMIKGLKKSL